MLEVLPSLEPYLFYAKDAWAPGILTGTGSQFISEATVRKTDPRVISERICMPATQLLNNKYLSLSDNNHL